MTNTIKWNNGKIQIESSSNNIGSDQLRHLVMQGAEKRYANKMTEQIKERIELELEKVNELELNYCFIIAQSIVATIRKMDSVYAVVWGAAPSSILCYCLYITDIDPIEHNLLFERFLNFKNRFAPSILICLDTDGYQKVSDWASENCSSIEMLDKEIAMEIEFSINHSLSIIKNTIKGLNQDININNISFEDKNVYKTITQVPITNFDSVGMQEFLQTFNPQKIEDLATLNTLYKIKQLDTIHEPIQKNKYPTNELSIVENVLKETYGFYVYQEQLMFLSQILADFTPDESNQLRRIMGMKMADKLEIDRNHFLEKAKSKGYESMTLEQIWEDWYNCSAYLFNKSHAIASTKISYQMAWLETYYPKELTEAVELQKNKDYE